MTDAELLAGLREQIRQRGWFRRPTGRIVAEMVLHVLAAVTGAYVMATAHGTAARLAGLLLSAAGSVGVGTNAHSSSHFATSSRRWVNELLTYFGYPFFLGVSATWWWHKHVAVHHPAPNVIGVDGDADLAPWFAITEEEAADGPAWRRLYYRHVQSLLFPLVLGITGFRMQAFGWQHLVAALLSNARSGHARKRRREWIDAAALLLHYAAWLGVPLLFLPARVVVGTYVARVVVIGYGLFAVLGPGHFPAAAACVPEHAHKGDYVLLQTASTVNFRTGRIGRLVCSGLEYQIEHHLFPNISHPYHPQVSRLVEEFCRAHGYPYRTYGWGRAVWEALSVFRRPKSVAHRLEALRTRPSDG